MTKPKQNGHGGLRNGSGRPKMTDAEKAVHAAAREAAKKALDGDADGQRAKVAAEPKRRVRQPMDLERLAEVLKMSTRRGARSFQPQNAPFKLADLNTLHPPAACPPLTVWNPATSPLLGQSKALLERGGMAMDSLGSWAGGAWSQAGGAIGTTVFEGQAFLGYPYLAELTQRPEYRVMSETIADDATRKWIDFEMSGTAREVEKRQREDAEDPDGAPERREQRLKKSGKADKVKELKAEMERLNLRDEIYQNCRNDGFFGRSHIFMNFGTDLDGAGDDELTTPIGDGRDQLSKEKVGKGSLKGFRTIEPVWTYPMTYNAVNPLRKDWYNPQVWYVLGKQIHVSRLLPFIGHPVSDLLKPAYSFGGISLSQMAQPYVDIWLQTRQAVAQLIHSFSIMVLSTDMQQMMMPNDAGGLVERAAEFNLFRDNMGLWIVNKETEEFSNVSAPLSGLHELQAQSQEHMCSVVRIPVMKFTGISPTGMNASSEGEIRAYYDTIAAYQNRLIRPNLTKILYFMQLSLWGEVDPEITFVFEPLWEMSEKERADLQKAEVERDQVLVDMGAFSPAEERERIIDDPKMPFGDLDPEDVPDLKQEEEQGLVPGEGGGKGLEAIFGEGGAGGAAPGGGGPGGAPGGGGPYPGGGGGNGPQPNNGGGGEPAKSSDPAFQPVNDNARRLAAGMDALFDGVRLAGDAGWGDWDEGDHPRDEGGQFTSKGGGVPGSSGLVPHPGNPWGGGGQHFSMPQYGLSYPPQHAHTGGGAYGGEPDDPFGWHGGFNYKPKPLDPTKLKKVGPQMGSNPGGVFEGADGRKFYVKKGQTKDHVRNELTAAKLMDLAGAETLRYRPVAGDEHVATEMEKLSKNNAHKFTPEERRKAWRDFAAHAWIGNYDAVGTGGDNLGIIKGEPVELDLGGALEYRARGKPKGDMFGDKVAEVDTMRDPNIAPDASAIFGDITPSAFAASARRVTRISDSAIKSAVESLGGKPELAEKLIKRRDDLAKRAVTFGAEGDPKKSTSTVVFAPGEKPPVKELNGIKFEPWQPPADGDWNDVDGQADLGEDDLPESVGGKQLASGVVVREKDGRIWVMKPKDAFGGYEATFPKGRVEPGLSMQANAIKEAYEETGLKVKIVGVQGDHEGDMTFTRYYVAEREGGDPADAGEESAGVVLAPKDKLGGFLNRKRDREIVAELGADQAFDWEEGKHPRGNTKNKGQFASTPGGAGGAQRNRGKTQQKPQQAQQGGSRAVAPSPGAAKQAKANEHAKVFGKAMAAQLQAAKEQVEGGEHAGEYEKHVEKTRKFFSSDEGRAGVAKAVGKWAKKHAQGVAEHHLSHVLIVPAVHHLVEAAVEHIGLATTPGITIGATAVAAYAVHHLMEHYHLTLDGGKELLTSAVRGAIDVLGGVKDVAARIQALEAEQATDAKDNTVLDALLLLLLSIEEVGEDDDDEEPEEGDGGAEDEAKFEESKHPRDQGGKFASKGNEGEGGGEEDFVEPDPPKPGSAIEAALNKAKSIVAAGVDPQKAPENLWPKLTFGEQNALIGHFGNAGNAQKSLAKFKGEAAALPLDSVAKALGFGGWTSSLTKEQKDEIEKVSAVQYEAAFNALSSGAQKKLIAALKGGVPEHVNVEALGATLSKGEKDDIKSRFPVGLNGALKAAYTKLKKGEQQALQETVSKSEEPDLDALIQEYKEWQEENGLSLGSAGEHLYDEDLTDEQRAWLKDFVDRWEQAEQAETDKAAGENDVLKKFETDVEAINADPEPDDLEKAETITQSAIKNGVDKDTLKDALSDHQLHMLTNAHGSLQDAIDAIQKDLDYQKPMFTDADWASGAEKILAAAKAGDPVEGLTDAEVAAIEEKYGSVESAYNTAKADAKLGEALGEVETPKIDKAKKTAFGGLWKLTGKGDKEDVQYNAGLIVGHKDVPGGQSYRQMIAYLIKKGPDAGVDFTVVNQLKVRLVESLYKAQTKAISQGKPDDASKIGKAIEQMNAAGEGELVAAGWENYQKVTGGKTFGQVAPKLSTAPKPAPPAAAPKPAEAPKPAPAAAANPAKHSPEFAAKLKDIQTNYPVSSKKSVQAKAKAAAETGATVEALAASLKPAEKAKVQKIYGSVEKLHEKFNAWYGPKSPNGIYKAKQEAMSSMPTTVGTKPTEAELTKAKKTVPLQLKYVPNAPQTAAAQKLVDEFNAKWGNNAVPDDATAIKKIDDFKALQKKMEPLMTEAQKNAAAEQQSAQKAAQEAAAKAQQQAKQAAEANKAANKKYMDALGISEAEAQGFKGLLKMLGGNEATLLDEFKKSTAASANSFAKTKMSGFEASLIQNYKQSSSHINPEMRKAVASWSEDKWAYAKVLNSALGKLPGYTGKTIRNTGLTAAVQQRYVPGHIVMEHGFTSSSKGSVFGGNTRFYITSTGKRGHDISGMYGFGGEEEVLFRAHTAFRIDKVEGEPGGSDEASYKVYMTEVDY